MLDIGWSELVVIIVVALVVIGPKDLPKVLKTVGLWIRKARMMAREFQGHVDDMIREAELEEVRKQANELRNLNIGREVEKAIDPTGSLRDAFDPNMSSGKTSTPPAAATVPTPPATTSAPASSGNGALPAPAPAPAVPAPAAPVEAKLPEPVPVSSVPASSHDSGKSQH